MEPIKVLSLQKAIVVLTAGKRNKSPLTAEEVIEVAKKFEDYLNPLVNQEGKDES